MPSLFQLELGVKTDPVEYRYSYDWLFRLLDEEGVRHVQLGTFFEIYQLPDAFFRDLRRRAEDHGLAIRSIFTAHRELGGFFRDDGPGWVEVAHRNFQRLITVGGILGAESVGSNPGAVLRDRMGTKDNGTRTYVKHMKQLMTYAKGEGVEWLTIEPMSCLAEPPTLPDEMRQMAEELIAHHEAHPDSTARVGFCVDVAHGYADCNKVARHDNIELLRAALPYTYEIHLKNTDALFNSTFGFLPAEREKGIIDVAQVRDLLIANSGKLLRNPLIGYLEIGGPKLGRDYSDGGLEPMLRESLRYLNEHFVTTAPAAVAEDRGRRFIEISGNGDGAQGNGKIHGPQIRVAPSLMCADLCNFESDVRRLESAGVELFHIDLMDAHFAPNMPLGLASVEQLRPKTAVPFDCHLMVENNELFVRELARVGVQQISVHVESCRHLDRVLNLVRELGIKAGVALNPATPVETIRYVLGCIDYVLVMTVNPGFAGQKLCAGAIRKIADTRAFLDAEGKPDLPIQVDGNVSFANIPAMVAAGASVLVGGTSSVFSKDGTIWDNVAKARHAAAEGLRQRGAPERANAAEPARAAK